MQLKTGSRWKSAVCATEIVVVRPPKSPVALQCGGQAMLPHGAEGLAGGEPAAGLDTGSLLGKRYGDETTGAEILCAKAGAGTLAFDGRPAIVKEAKKLPSSD